jgi:hypothetical protein
MGAVSSEAISSALRTIRARLSEVEREIESLENERDALRHAEQSLLAVIRGEIPSAAAAETAHPPEQPARLPRQSSLRTQLYTALQTAGPGGQSIHQLREQFPDATKMTIAARLSNLKRAGLIDNNRGAWFCRETSKASEIRSSGGGSEALKNGNDEPSRWSAVERDYDSFTDPRTGVTLARRA